MRTRGPNKEHVCAGRFGRRCVHAAWLSWRTPPSINVFLHNKGRLLLSCLGRCQSISFANNPAPLMEDEEIFTSAQLWLMSGGELDDTASSLRSSHPAWPRKQFVAAHKLLCQSLTPCAYSGLKKAGVCCGQFFECASTPCPGNCLK